MSEQVEALNELGDHIVGQMPDAVRKFEIAYGELTLFAERDQIIALVEFLKRDALCMFEMMFIAKMINGFPPVCGFHAGTSAPTSSAACLFEPTPPRQSA